MEFLTVEQVISIILSFLSLLFAIFLLTAKTKNYVSNVIISQQSKKVANVNTFYRMEWFVWSQYIRKGTIIWNNS